LNSQPASGWGEPRSRGASFSAKRGLEARLHSENAWSFALVIQPLGPAILVWASLLAGLDLTLLLVVLLFVAQSAALFAAAKSDRRVLSERGFATHSHPSSAIATLFPFAYLWKRFVLYASRDPDAARPFTRHIVMIGISAIAIVIAGLWGIPMRLLLSR